MGRVGNDGVIEVGRESAWVGESTSEIERERESERERERERERKRKREIKRKRERATDRKREYRQRCWEHSSAQVCTRVLSASRRQLLVSGDEIASACGLHSVSMLGGLIGNYHHGKSCVRPAKGNLLVMKS